MLYYFRFGELKPQRWVVPEFIGIDDISNERYTGLCIQSYTSSPLGNKFNYKVGKYYIWSKKTSVLEF
jgi:hypothetical protein